MRTIDWVSADSDKASLSVGCGGKTTGWLFVQYLSLKSRALWYTSPWEQTLQNDHRKCQISGFHLPTVMIFRSQERKKEYASFLDP